MNDDKYRGCLLGLATGDALGTTLEFRSPGSFEAITDMNGGGPFRLQAGQWTDDTSMALCLADSLLACQGMDLSDQCERYLSWRDNGVNSATGDCFDIGCTVSSALANYRTSGNPRSGPTDQYSAGNGSIMRLAPVPLYYHQADIQKMLARCEESSLTTHGASEAIWCCRLLGILIRQALAGETQTDLLIFPPEQIAKSEHGGPKSEGVQRIIDGSWRQLDPPDIAGTGYVVKSLEAAIWAFAKGEDFRHGALLAANLGDDADTTCAIYGQIAGAFWGETGIPDGWLAKLSWREKIADLALQLTTERAQ